jgi:hypothetical protein
MDERLRELQRRASAGDEEALAELDARARRLGTAGAGFRAPATVPDREPAYDDPVLYRTQHETSVEYFFTPQGRRWARARSHRRNRQQVRRALQRGAGGGRGRPPDEDLDALY